MKALQLTNYKRLEIADVPEPVMGAEDVLIAIRACGICGSDVHGYDGSTGRRIPPMVMGHEAAGVVEAVGSAVKDFAPGDRVTFDSTVYCGKCFYCLRGEVNLCEDREVVGVSTPLFKRTGAFAESIAVPQRIVYKLPDGLPFEHAAMIEAVSVAAHAVALSSIRRGDTAIVIGAGMIGLLTLQVVKHAGAERVLVLDVDASRLKLAKSLGATETFVSGSEEASKTIREAVLAMTEGRGADVALECVGITPAINDAIENVRKGGTVTLVGNIAPRVEVGLQSIVTRQIRVQGSCASAGEYPESMEMMASGAVRVDGLISAVATLEDGPQWFERLYSREPGLMKVVLTPQEAA